MKLGTENPKKLVFMLVLLAAALYLLLRNFSEDTTAAAPAITTQPGAAGAPARRGAQSLALNTDDASPRRDLFRENESTQYKGTGRNHFNREAGPPKKAAPAVVAKPDGPPGA